MTIMDAYLIEWNLHLDCGKPVLRIVLASADSQEVRRMFKFKVDNSALLNINASKCEIVATVPRASKRSVLFTHLRTSDPTQA